jgi:hypothetical protein
MLHYNMGYYTELMELWDFFEKIFSHEFTLTLPGKGNKKEVLFSLRPYKFFLTLYAK